MTPQHPSASSSRIPLLPASPPSNTSEPLGERPTAPQLLKRSAELIEERGKRRDQPNGERTMQRCVSAFNHLFQHQLTVEDGWKFMAVLKLARSHYAFDIDDLLDGAAYMALANEEAALTQSLIDNNAR